MSMDSLVVSEIFGPTFQGEGPSAGQRAMFLRLGGCNLTCLGCDTPYTWRFSSKLPHRQAAVYDPKAELRGLDFSEIIESLCAIDAPMLVISGGEPLLQGARLARFVPLMVTMRNQIRIEVETNGTHIPPKRLESLIDQWNVSPKLSHWGNDPDQAYRPDTIEYWRELPYRMASDGWACSRVVFKFVCRNGSDVSEAESMVHEHKIEPRSVWIMPEGADRLELMTNMPQVRDKALEYGFNVTARLHLLLWPDRFRGV
jgi:7-carboxy-7-deazaguanine synthase